jgi:hypothetical protein
MQEEVAKHTKKIYNTAKNQNHTFGQKVREIMIEIFIIVFAVTLSIWLHSRSEHSHQQKEVKEFLMDLKEDLKNDVESISKAKEELAINIEDYKLTLGFTQSKMDSLINANGSIGFNATISTTKTSNANYEGFKSSGKIGYIENKKLKRQILKYYQEQLLELLEAEKYSAATFEKVLNVMSGNADKGMDKIIMLPEFKYQLKQHTNQTIQLVDGYSKALAEANEIIVEIDKFKY